jgi:hypothetical protein
MANSLVSGLSVLQISLLIHVENETYHYLNSAGSSPWISILADYGAVFSCHVSLQRAWFAEPAPHGKNDWLGSSGVSVFCLGSFKIPQAEENGTIETK